MPDYLLLYHGVKLPRNRFEQMDQAAELERWSREISNAVLDGGSPISGGKKITKSEIKSLRQKPVTSYCIIEADNIDEAVELSRGAPPLHEGGEAEVYEIVTEE